MQIELAEKYHKISRECQQICSRKAVESLHIIFLQYKVTQAQNWGIHLLFVKTLINNSILSILTLFCMISYLFSKGFNKSIGFRIKGA